MKPMASSGRKSAASAKPKLEEPWVNPGRTSDERLYHSFKRKLDALSMEQMLEFREEIYTMLRLLATMTGDRQQLMTGLRCERRLQKLGF